MASGESVKDSSGDGSVTAGAPIVAPGTPLAPGYDCDSTVSYPSTLYIEGEPIGDPADGKVILDLPGSDEAISLLVPAPGFENSGIPEMIVVDPAIDYPKPELYAEDDADFDITVPTLYGEPEVISVSPVHADQVQDGSAIGMPVPILADDAALTDEASEAPMPISAPPAIMPTPEQADPTLVDPLPIPATLPAYECESESASGFSSGSSGSSSGTIEPVEIVDGVILVEPTDDERAANIMVVEAPIESAGITVSESSPQQYMLWVVSGLSNGATSFGDYAVKRDGNIVAVSITNYVQTDVMSTQVYGIHQSNIQLGRDFASGEWYEVVINGRTWTEFKAQ